MTEDIYKQMREVVLTASLQAIRALELQREKLRELVEIPSS